ncbi:type I-C CRISPR-associated protein Cas8c/Csd1 [Methanogenium cariaci]|uniref:type I-C CRISPR-associated protein Cas8c/Csd1 n=1 Tax=Methanogenium cariaci TaxID=2197 RepID=UPI001C446149|nr:type I-C CRISPR-associated protein Cas8c/Csd1 [Methanogenium cariaci]
MIIQSLCEYYDILDNDENIPIPRPPGYSRANVSFNLVISETGEISNIVDLRTDDKKPPRPQMMEVPQQKSRANGVNPPYFLCDNVKYVFGVERLKRPEFEKSICTNQIVIMWCWRKMTKRSFSQIPVQRSILRSSENCIMIFSAAWIMSV